MKGKFIDVVSSVCLGGVWTATVLLLYDGWTQKHWTTPLHTTWVLGKAVVQ